MLLPLYLNDEEFTDKDGPELPKWAELPLDERKKILDDLERNIRWRKEQHIEVDEKLRGELIRRFIIDPWIGLGFY